MMKTIVAVAAVLMLSGCSYMSSPVIYVDAQGREHETTEKMAHLMVQRDVATSREQSVQMAFANAATPEAVVAAVALALRPGQNIDRPRSAAEEWLPWVQVLNPWLMAAIGVGGNGGGASASGDGAAFSLNRSSNNTFLVTTQPQLTSSNFYPGLTSSNTRYTVLNTGEEAQTSATGSNTRDQSTETYTGDSALVPAP